MYAMDYPYQYVPEEVRFCDEMTIPDEHKKMFFQSNAEHVFKLNTRRPYNRSHIRSTHP